MEVNGVKVLAAKLEGADTKTLRDTMDKLKDKLKTAVIVLGAVDGDKVQIAAGVTNDTTGKVKAGELANFVAAGGWQRRRQGRHGHGWWYRAGQAGRCVGQCAGLGQCQAVSRLKLLLY